MIKQFHVGVKGLPRRGHEGLLLPHGGGSWGLPGGSPLHPILAKERPEREGLGVTLTRLALDFGPDHDLKSVSGETPLGWAVRRGKKTMVKLLQGNRATRSGEAAG